jgi:hypothetical protein
MAQDEAVATQKTGNTASPSKVIISDLVVALFPKYDSVVLTTYPIC